MTYEQEIKILENALDKACEYIHNNGLNGCPLSYDVEAVDKEKEKECVLCKFNCSARYEYSNKEYEKKSKECWKEFFFRKTSKRIIKMTNEN